MSSTFGQPQFGTVEDAATTDTANQNGAGDAPQEILDPNDPQLTSEILEANLEADAYAFPPPPPDGKYRAKLKLAQQEDPQKQKVDFLPAIWGKDLQKVFVASVEASIIDPNGKFDGIKLYERNVATFLQRGGATKVHTLLARLKQPSGEPWATPATRLSPRGWMDLLVKALAGEPEVGVETAWEWNCQKCGEEAKAKKESYPRAITGMHKFQQKLDSRGNPIRGEYSPELLCQANKAHGYSRARATIARFLHLSELK